MKYPHQPLLGKRNFVFVLAGIALILLGYLLMAGGASPDPNVYPEAEIYGFRRTILAPILVLVGLGLQLVAIFTPTNAKVLNYENTSHRAHKTIADAIAEPSASTSETATHKGNVYQRNKK